MKKSIEAGALTEEAAALLQSAESKLFGQVGKPQVCMHGGAPDQVCAHPAGQLQQGKQQDSAELADSSFNPQPPYPHLWQRRFCPAAWPARWCRTHGRTGRRGCALSTTRGTAAAAGRSRESRRGSSRWRAEGGAAASQTRSMRVLLCRGLSLLVQ
jgi:hypothetical protein